MALVKFRSYDQAGREGRLQGIRKRERKYEREVHQSRGRLVLGKGEGRGGNEIQYENLPPTLPLSRLNRVALNGRGGGR